MFAAADVLAHQGGWDEMLMVAVPIVLFVVLLRVANARALRDDESPGPTDDDGNIEHHNPDTDRAPDPSDNRRDD